MFKFMNNKKGFTLVELMIVVVIMAILVAVAVPIYNAVTDNAKKKTCDANARILSETMSQIMMGTIGGGNPVQSLTAATGLTATTPISTFRSGVTDDVSLGSQVQGDFPECPFEDNEGGGTYQVATDGEVTCSGTHGS